jgi:lysophospholipase L1-like esterase
MRLPVFLALTILSVSLAAAAQNPAPAPMPKALTGAVTFTCGAARGGEKALTATTTYSEDAAGWDLGTSPISVAGGVCSAPGETNPTPGVPYTPSIPLFFSIPVPEGNYRVTLELGGGAASVMTVRAEARRLYVEKLPIAAGKTVTRELDVNVRVAEFTKPDGTPGKVRLKAREIGNLDWDHKLTIEFNGVHPSIKKITVQPITEPVVYLAGDSTMVDQDVEPWASWGQMLPRFFKPGVVIANHAESGESSSSFVGEQRFPKIMSLIKPGDWFFVQFAHNDQKLGPDFPEKYRKIMTDFVTQVKAKGATPVIVTAMNRDEWDETGKIKQTLGPYPEISREVAKATGTALIDLNDMSKTMFEAMGKEGTEHAFMKFAANTFPDQVSPISDSTHFNNYGAYELARCIVHGIREDKLGLEKFLDPSVPDFDPARPDLYSGFHLAYTPMQKKEDTTKIPQANLK